MWDLTTGFFPVRAFHRIEYQCWKSTRRRDGECAVYSECRFRELWLYFVSMMIISRIFKLYLESNGVNSLIIIRQKPWTVQVLSLIHIQMCIRDSLKADAGVFFFNRFIRVYYRTSYFRKNIFFCFISFSLCFSLFLILLSRIVVCCNEMCF